MKHKIYQQITALIFTFALGFFGFGFSSNVAAQNRPYRASDRQVENVLRRIETKTDRFRRSLDPALDRSRFDERNREEGINGYVKNFENATDELRRKFDGRTAIGADVQTLIVSASPIDAFMCNNLRRSRAAPRS